MLISNPLKWKVVTQPFGVNYVDFYRGLGMKGHNGIDYRAPKGTPCLACFDGKVVASHTDSTGGNEIRLKSDYNEQGVHFEAIYYHLSVRTLKIGDKVKVGDIVGISGNTGKYTTSAHLHFGLKKVEYKDGKRIRVLNHSNGYYGAIDPEAYFIHKGEYLPVDCHYNQKRSWWLEFKIRFKIPWIHRQLIKMGRKPGSLTNREVTALSTGRWGWHEIVDPSMYPVWNTLTKMEYLQRKSPEIRLIR